MKFTGHHCDPNQNNYLMIGEGSALNADMPESFSQSKMAHNPGAEQVAQDQEDMAQDDEAEVIQNGRQ